MKNPLTHYHHLFHLTIVLGLLHLAFLCSSCTTSVPPKITTISPRPDIVFPATPFTTSTAQEKARRAFTRGSVLAMRRKPAEAIVEFQEALQYDTTAAIYFALAKSYRDMVKNDLARIYVEKALALDEKFAEALELLIELQVSQMNIEQAIQNCKRLVDIDSSCTNRFRLGNVYELWDKEKAAEVYSTIVQDCDESDVLLRLAALYSTMGRITDYTRALERLHDNEPENVYVFTALQEAYLSQKEYAKTDSLMIRLARSIPSEMVVEDYARFGVALLQDSSAAATTIIPRYLSRMDNRFYFSTELHELSGYLSERIGDSVQMEHFFQHALRIADTSAALVLRIGIHYLQSKRPSRAAIHFRRYEKAFPRDARMPLYCAFAYSAMDSLPLALYALYRAIGIDSSMSDAWFQMGHLYDKLHNLDSSDYCYEQVLKIEPYHTLTCNNYAYSLSLRDKNLARALELSYRSLGEDSLNASYLDTYGWILHRMGKYSEAAVYLERAVKNNNASATLLEHLGDNYSKLGLTEKAADAWRKALELDASRTYLRERLLLMK